MNNYKDYPSENGVIITPASPEERAYVSFFIQTCKRYNINYTQADDMEKQFVEARVDYLMSQQAAS